MRQIVPSLAAVAALACLGATSGAQASTGPIAPQGACPGQNAGNASLRTQRRAMRCLTAYARRRAGLASLSKAGKLDRSARGKAGDILRCDSFSHSACGRDFTYWMQRSGYLAARCWRVGENLAWGTGEAGTVRSIFRAWMKSPDHRRNILSPRYGQLGVSVRVGELGPYRDAHVWAQHFGSHCR